MIEGVKITKLKILRDQRGSVLTMLRSDSKVYESFGEIYFSTIFIKIKLGILNYACIKGKVKLILYDDRKNSKSFGKYDEYILTPKNIF